MRRGKYELKRRAERRQQTRRRIVEAAVELHETIGGTRATISAIAEKAGVERRTVYNHFANDFELASACMAHYNAANPPPDPSAWTEIADPEERLRYALGEVYAYFRRNERLLANFAVDAQLNSDVREAAEPIFRYWERALDVIVAAWEDGGRNRILLVAVELALDFQTWRTLTSRGQLHDEQAIELMIGMVRCRTRD